MEPTNTAYGTWSGGRFMHFGETLSEQRFLGCISTAYEAGIRTFVTSDVYGNGKADELLGQALKGIDRSSYSLVGMIGHDFYDGERKGSQGYPRFTDPELRGPDGYDEFVQRATKRSLERCGTDHFDLLMLHNPDDIGYTSEALWAAMARAKKTGLTRSLGMAPGPANGFTLDLLAFFEKFGSVIDWTMLILNPLEPWPSNLLLDSCVKNNIKVLTRVVDYGGIFHDDINGKDHVFKPGDHRTYRPEGWVEHGLEKVERMRPIAKKYNLSLLEFACLWNLSQAPVECVVPTFIQEAGENARPIEEKIREFGKMPDLRLTPEEVELVRQIGDNTGCMKLKGASKRHATSERCDEWPMRPELLEIAEKNGLGSNW
jgi:aryl-alcohol dehydrogenase-like predicted oxidoreductase